MVMGNDYHREYQRSRYNRRLGEAKTRLGGKCVLCGSTESLQFDHVDRSSKVMAISLMTRLSQEKFDQELAKCQLLCFPCHIEKSKQERWSSG